MLDSADEDDVYYDGDQQEPAHVDLFQTIDCSIQCPPYWTEPLFQEKQTLVYPTSASVSLKCPYNAKPKAKLTWYKDGQIFLPELYQLVGQWSIDLHFDSLSFILVFNRSNLSEYFQSDHVRSRIISMCRRE